MARPDRRDQILRAAIAVRAESGEHGVSVRAVAARAGIGMGTLRHYFPTQKDLHRELVLRLFDDTIQDFDIRDRRVPPVERLERCVRQFVPGDTESADSLQVWFGMYRSALEPGGGELPRQFLEVATVRAHASAAGWLAILAEEGHADPACVDEDVALLVSVVSGICLELMTPGSTVTVPRAHRALARAVRDVIIEESR